MNKNENMTDEMIEILEEVHKYVPTRHKTVADDKSGRMVSWDLCHTLLICGDQLTRKRIESARDMRRNGITPHSQLTGLMPVCEVWHTKGIFWMHELFLIVLAIDYFLLVFDSLFPPFSDGNISMIQVALWNKEQCANYKMQLIEGMYLLVLTKILMRVIIFF